MEHKNISCLIPTGFGHIAYITDTELQKNNKKYITTKQYKH
jgi:hypothetical protein